MCVLCAGFKDHVTFLTTHSIDEFARSLPRNDFQKLIQTSHSARLADPPSFSAAHLACLYSQVTDSTQHGRAHASHVAVLLGIVWLLACYHLLLLCGLGLGVAVRTLVFVRSPSNVNLQAHSSSNPQRQSSQPYFSVMLCVLQTSKEFAAKAVDRGLHYCTILGLHPSLTSNPSSKVHRPLTCVPPSEV